MAQLEIPDDCLGDVVKVIRLGLEKTAPSPDACGNKAWELLHMWCLEWERVLRRGGPA